MLNYPANPCSKDSLMRRGVFHGKIIWMLSCFLSDTIQRDNLLTNSEIMENYLMA